jgi:hypothetical protein
LREKFAGENKSALREKAPIGVSEKNTGLRVARSPYPIIITHTTTSNGTTLNSTSKIHNCIQLRNSFCKKKIFCAHGASIAL